MHKIKNAYILFSLFLFYMFSIWATFTRISIVQLNILTFSVNYIYMKKVFFDSDLLKHLD